MGVAVPRIVKLNRSSEVHKRVGLIDVGSLNQTTTAQFGAFSFTFGAFPDNSSLIGVYDAFRVDQMDLIIKPMAYGLVDNDFFYPMLVAADLNDDAAPTTMTTLLAYENVTIVGPHESCVKSCVPSVNLSAFDGTAAVANAAMSSGNSWYATAPSAAVSTVEFYGFKWGVEANASAAVSISWRIYARVHLSLLLQR